MIGHLTMLLKNFPQRLWRVLKISGKSTKPLFNWLSLLKLSDEIRMAIVPPLSGLNRAEGKTRREKGSSLFFRSSSHPDARVMRKWSP
jgi:hypothetical protein